MVKVLPHSIVHGIVALLFVANTVNLGADLAAMGAAAHLVLGWGNTLFAIFFGAGSLLLQIFVPYHRYVHLLKWLTLALFAYVGVLFSVEINWTAVVRGVLWPQFASTREALTTVVAVFGTTISPYLFFWQGAEEVEDETLTGAGSLLDHPEAASGELRRIAFDTYVGMAFSNLIAFFIMLTTAVTLNTAGITRMKARHRRRRCFVRSPARPPSCSSALASSAPVFSPCRSSRAPPLTLLQSCGAGDSAWSRGLRTRRPSTG